MIVLQTLSSKTKLPDSDYTFDKIEHFQDLLKNLTPKFEGTWKVILLSPKIKYVKELVDQRVVPDWMDVIVYVSQKALEEIAVEYPSLMPKKLSAKEEYARMIGNMKHLIDKQAINAIYKSVGANTRELQKVLNELDESCPDNEVITMKHVKGLISIVKRVYASDVLKAFLLNDSKKWELYNKLVHDVGLDIAYFAMYKQVKLLLSDKCDYLQNKDVKSYTARKVDATFICYVYVLFTNSHSSYQLPALLYAIEHRSEEMLYSTKTERK